MYKLNLRSIQEKCLRVDVEDKASLWHLRFGHLHHGNKSTIELTKNPVNHERSKHIKVRFHFIQDHVKEGNLELLHVASQDQVVDIFTKPLLKVLFDKYKKMISMTDA